MTTYQRLKKENEILRRELDIVCNDETIEAIQIKHKYKLLRSTEKAVMNGTHCRLTIMNGFLQSVK